MPVQKMLEQLNIPEREAQVYIVLLKLGLTTVGPIVTKTKLHEQIVIQMRFIIHPFYQIVHECFHPVSLIHTNKSQLHCFEYCFGARAN